MTERPPDLDKLEHFAANVAHDFNNLLTGILGNLELMESRAARAGLTQFDGYLEGARNAGGRAASFAQRLLAFSGRAAHESEAVDLNAMIHSLIDPQPDQTPRMSFTASAEPANVFCDPTQAELVLHELLNNAADSATRAKAIRISTEITGSEAVLSVQDDGSGMAPEILARAREPFFSTQPSGAGKGLGLPIAERFARRSGGSLELLSEAGRGTVVRLRLPLFRGSV